jgi:hypothetical protein
MDGGLRTLFRKHLPTVQWSTIETATAEPGMPDLNGCWQGVDIWVEAKLTSGYSVLVKPSQVAWHTLRAANGGRSFFAVRRTKPFRHDELYLVRGNHAGKLRGLGLSAVPHACMSSGGPANWDWDRVLKVLVAR